MSERRDSATEESKYRALAENSEDIIARFDLTGHHLYVNSAIEKVFGLPASDFIGKTNGEIGMPAELCGMWDESRLQVIQTKQAVRIEFEFQSPTDLVVYDCRLVPEFDEEGNVCSVLSVARDITDLKQEEILLRKREQRYREVRYELKFRRDAKLATKVQNALLSVPDSSDYLEIDTIYEPFSYVGGDLYFMDWRYDGSMLRGFLADATGHGLSTALHTASLHVLLREVNQHDLPLSDAMRWLNRRAGDYFNEGIFAGALGFELDLQTRQLRLVCAGIPRTWVATKTQRGVVECPGMCLGIREDETFDTHLISVDVGASLYFVTHGLADLLVGPAELPLDRYPEMVALLRTLSESADRRDDATAVCIHIRSFPQSLVRQGGWPRIIRFNGYGDYLRLRGEVTKILEEVTGMPHSLQEVAVHEALANAMECRDGLPRPHKARLRFNKVGNMLIVRVKTSRMGFAGNAILKRLQSNPEDVFSFGEDAAMGRGIPMMFSMSHQMTYNSDGTEVLLAWKL